MCVCVCTVTKTCIPSQRGVWVRRYSGEVIILEEGWAGTLACLLEEGSGAGGDIYDSMYIA